MFLSKNDEERLAGALACLDDVSLARECLFISACLSMDFSTDSYLLDDLIMIDNILSFEVCRRFCARHMPENTPDFCLASLNIDRASVAG